MKKTLMIIMSMGMMAFATSAQAGSAGGSLDVNATALASCSVTSSAVAFGNYDGSAEVAAPMASFGQSCNGPVDAVYSLGAGNNLAGGTRQMDDGAGNLLAYDLYKDSGFTALFGDGTHGTTKSFTGIVNNTASHAVWGKLPAGQTFTPGVYADVVTATLTY